MDTNLRGQRFIRWLSLGVFALILFQPAAAPARDQHDAYRGASDEHDEHYELPFIPTQNLPQHAEGVMRLTVRPDTGETTAHLTVRKASPNTVYTIWTVFNKLRWPLPTTGTSVPSDTAAGFPSAANGVSPLARLDDAFTSGMGLDPGATFTTDERGNGQVSVRLDYDLVRGAPISNKNLLTQCVRPVNESACSSVRVTTTWLRTFIGEFALHERASMCANYDPNADPDMGYDDVARRGMDARLWQCVDPASVNDASGRFVVRVPRFEWDHFRLANHPDSLTHGFIGGTHTDHIIDMVGRRSDLIRVWPKPIEGGRR
jgi:hypothetical protein